MGTEAAKASTGPWTEEQLEEARKLQDKLDENERLTGDPFSEPPKQGEGDEPPAKPKEETPPAAKPTTSTEENPSEPAKPNSDPAIDTLKNELADLRVQLNKALQAKNDTKSDNTKLRQRIKALEEEAEQRKLKETRPKVLDEIEGIEDAIEYEIKRRGLDKLKPKEEPEEEIEEETPPAKPAQGGTQGQPPAFDKETWTNTLLKRVPGLDAYLEIPEFQKLADAKATELGPKFLDVDEATAAFVGLLTDFRVKETETKVKTEVENERKNSLRSVPGSGSAAVEDDTPSDAAEVQKLKSMSDDELEALIERNKRKQR